MLRIVEESSMRFSVAMWALGFGSALLIFMIRLAASRARWGTFGLITFGLSVARHATVGAESELDVRDVRFDVQNCVSDAACDRLRSECLLVLIVVGEVDTGGTELAAAVRTVNIDWCCCGG